MWYRNMYKWQAFISNCKNETIMKNRVSVKSFKNWFQIWHSLTVLPIIKKEKCGKVYERMISSGKDHPTKCNLEHLVKWGLNIQFTSTARCNPGCMKKECDLCWEVYSVTGREFAVGLRFIVNYPLDTGIQYRRAAIDLNRFIDLWAEKYHEVARKILPLLSAH